MTGPGAPTATTSHSLDGSAAGIIEAKEGAMSMQLEGACMNIVVHMMQDTVWVRNGVVLN